MIASLLLSFLLLGNLYLATKSFSLKSLRVKLTPTRLSGFSTPRNGIIATKGYRSFLHKLHYSTKNGNFDEDGSSVDEDGSQGSELYTQRQLLKEETEAPFRNVRLYFYFALLAAAGLSSFICFTQLLAFYTGANTSTDVDALYRNLGVNFIGIPILLYFWKRDVDDRNQRLQRIQRGGSLAGLKVKFDYFIDGPKVLKLNEFRRNRGIEKRIVIVVAKKEQVRDSLQSSLSLSDALFGNDLLIVPIVLLETEKDSNDGNSNDGNSIRLVGFNLDELTVTSTTDKTNIDTSKSSILAALDRSEALKHIVTPVGLSFWNDVLNKELQQATTQQTDALDKGLTIVIKKNGKVGTRRFGVPIWEGLVDDVEMRKELGMDVRNI